MSLTLKDAVYLLVYVVSIAGLYFKFNNRLINIEKARKREYSILWQNGGRLNLVDHKTCREFRDQIWDALRKCDSSSMAVLNKLEVINEKLIRIDGKIKGGK
jgi:hypothetical protein